MAICENCLHKDVCGLEGSYDEALKYCAEYIPSITNRIYSEVIPNLADRINKSLPDIINSELKCSKCYYYANYPYRSIYEWIEDAPGIYRCPTCGHTEGKHRAFCCDCGSKFKVESEVNNE